MKWTEEAKEELRTLCMKGTGNAELAKHFSVPVTEIYGARSRLGLTIDKCRAMQEESTPQDECVRYNSERFRAFAELNAKRSLVQLLEPAIKKADETVASLSLENQGEYVLIRFKNGHTKKVDVEADSLLAIIADVVRGLH